jgi:hypothetical protein
MRPLHATFGAALLKAHRALIEDIQKLESTPIAAGSPADDLVACLQRTRAQLAEHFRFEEQNGYLTSVLERNPHLGHAVERLGAEHGELLSLLDELCRQARSAATVSAELSPRVGDWARKVRRHEQRENILVEDAYNLDLGTKD